MEEEEEQESLLWVMIRVSPDRGSYSAAEAGVHKLCPKCSCAQMHPLGKAHTSRRQLLSLVIQFILKSKIIAVSICVCRIF